MNNGLLDVIRIANREFQEFIDQVAQNGAKVVESHVAVRRLEKVDLRLKQVAQYLAAESRSAAKAPEAAYEILKYRETLKTLRSVMETLQFSLLAEKARLENVRANLQAASAWATSLREIS
jgi:DNA repair exonuclease SbcCD ATPase subunit